tara:strand:- start:300 stop:584 length:285 start_codon:yes stop_codon:yes gene_type:complete
MKLNIKQQELPMAMNFFEITDQQHKATQLGEYMMGLTYKIKEDHDMAVRLMRLADKLADLDALFGTRWERDFDAEEKQLITNCYKLMEKENAPS